MVKLRRLLYILHPLQRVTVIFKDRSICGHAYYITNTINYQRPEFMDSYLKWSDINIDYEMTIDMSEYRYGFESEVK